MMRQNSEQAQAIHEIEKLSGLPFDAVPPCKAEFRKTLDFIRDSYARYAESGVRPHTYFIDWVRIFTPIESAAWGAIRYIGLPMLPQYPIGPYFADFADPDAMVVLECDGRQFHQDKERDAARDRFMIARGWTVYRVTGRECKAPEIDWEVVSEMRHEGDKDEAIQMVEKWMLSSVEGVLSAISVEHYGKRLRSAPAYLIEESLRRHAATGAASRRAGFGGA